MTKALSLGIRRRVIRAVEEEGMSGRATATRFGVAALFARADGIID